MALAQGRHILRSEEEEEEKVRGKVGFIFFVHKNMFVNAVPCLLFRHECFNECFVLYTTLFVFFSSFFIACVLFCI